MLLADDKPDRPLLWRLGRGHQLAEGIEHLLELSARVVCHLPACFIECAEGDCRQNEIVGQEHQRLAGLGVFEADTASS